MYGFQVSSKPGTLLEEYCMCKHCIQMELLLQPIYNSGDVYMIRCQKYAQKCDTLYMKSPRSFYSGTMQRTL